MNGKNQTITKVTALYCRLSIEDGRDNESMSISNQKLMLKGYADKHGLYPCEYYVDMYNQRLIQCPAYRSVEKRLK